MTKLRWSLGLVLLLAIISGPAVAQDQKPKFENWAEIAGAMEKSLNLSYEAYFQKDVESGKNRVNDAYFGYYEKEGFERAVMSYISGKRGAQVEYQFSIIKKQMTDGEPNQKVRKSIDDLIRWLQEDARQLDGKDESAIGVFAASLIIILREGFEAILVIAAMAAYLNRSGNGQKTRIVYQSALAAIGASVAAAIGLQYVFNLSGANQEILEGVAMLLATVVLFLVSNWMFAKSEAANWKNYIQGKVEAAVTSGSAWALGAAAFLAVFREGAETILFYQAMAAGVGENFMMVWAGLGVGCLALVVIFIAIRYGSMLIPIKPFFMGTSILMYVMAIAFAGGGIKELQEGDVIGVTPVSWISSIDLLGLYPTVETLLPQVILLSLALVSIFHYRLKSRRVAACEN